MGQMNDVEHSEDLEIAPVGGRDSLDARAVITGSEQRIENMLAPQSMPLHPVDEQRKRVLRWLDDATFTRPPPLVADLQCFAHLQWFRETSRVSHDMRELSQHLRADRAAGFHASDAGFKQLQAGRVRWVLSNRQTDQETGIQTDQQSRSSISSSRSSADVSG